MEWILSAEKRERERDVKLEFRNRRLMAVCAAVWMTLFISVDARSQIRGRLFSQRGAIASTLTTGQLREGQLTDGLSSLVVKDGRFSEMTIAVLPQDEVWLLDGRDAHCDPNNLSLIGVRRLVGQQWVDDQLANLVLQHSTDRAKKTLIYAHGNRTDEEWAIARGLQFYQNAFGNTGDCRPPVRLVIWSWRAEQEGCRPARDFAEKSDRSVVVGPALVNLLLEFPDRNLLLVGFSLGAQSLLSALGDSRIQANQGEFQPEGYRVVLIAPALDGCYVASQIHQYPSPLVVDRAEIFDNREDRALRVAKIVGRKQSPNGDISIGELAARGNLPLNNVQITDMAEATGKGHSIDRYSRNDAIRNCLNQMLWELADDVQPVVQ